MGSHDHIGDLAPAGDQDADLAVDLPGELRELAGQVVGDDPLRRDAPPVKLSDPFDLIRPESGQIAVNLFDVGSFNSRLFPHPLFHPVEKARPGIGPKGGDQLSRLLHPAGRAWGFFLPDFHEPFEDVVAADTFIFVDGHDFLCLL
jgi:hypothetical protein